MLTPQIDSTTTLSRNPRAIFNKLANGPVYIATHSEKSAVLLSVPDYENLLILAEEAKRLKRLMQMDRDFAEMRAGKFTLLTDDLAVDNANSSQ